jgi:streptomycin 3"-adenylyltransferase
MIPGQAREVAEELAVYLGDNLVGVYLHGSFALGCGNLAVSDIDLLVVTRRRLELEERVLFAVLPTGRYDEPGWPRPLELSVVTLEQLHPWRHPTPYDLHLAPRGIVAPGVDADLAAHITVTRRAGVALVGPPPPDVFPEVPRADYEDSLLRDFRSSLEADTEDRRYAILSTARIWAQLAEPDELHTKESGAIWALARLPPDLRRPLELALASYRTDGRDVDVTNDELRAYLDAVAAEVRRLRP